MNMAGIEQRIERMKPKVTRDMTHLFMLCATTVEKMDEAAERIKARPDFDNAEGVKNIFIYPHIPVLYEVFGEHGMTFNPNYCGTDKCTGDEAECPIPKTQ